MTPAEHDVIRVTDLSHGGSSVECACGRCFVDTSPEKARNRHARHHHVETVGKPGVAGAREALGAAGAEMET